jgi:uncharacterized protein YcgI (DUF1989 family)
MGGEVRKRSPHAHGGNFALIVAQLDLVVVMTSLPHTNDDVVGTGLAEFLVLARLIAASAS